MRMLAVAAAVAVALTGLSGPAGLAAGADCAAAASADWPITRLAGADRYATAACTSATAYPDGTTTAVLARGDAAGGWADALAGTVLAHAVDGPVLLTDPGTLPRATAEELARLGAERVLLLGGTAAIGRDVAAAVRDLGIATERIAGRDRAATAAAVAGRAGSPDHAFLVNGSRPADALVAGAAAARSGASLLLVGAGSIPPVTDAALSHVTRVTIVGGQAVVGPEVEAALVARLGAPAVHRLSGPSRTETAASVARVHPGDGTVHLVSGEDDRLVDAISSSWLAARRDGGPVLYEWGGDRGRGTDRWLRLGGLEDASPTRIVGGTAAVGPAAVAALEEDYAEAARGGPPAQMRALWVHLFDDALKSTAGIDRVLDAAAAANLNTVIVQAARRHDAYYDSDVLPRTTDPAMPDDLDLLARLLPAAHARGLEVHVWYSLMPTIHRSIPPASLPADHIWKRHGPAGAGGSWMAAVQTPWYDFLDPAIPGVQDHVAAMLREVVERYDVDGVHLDYLRYEGGADTEHPVSMQRHRDHGGGTSLDAWRRRQTQDLARRIYLEVAAADPDVVVSMAAIAQGEGPHGARTFADTKAYGNPPGQHNGKYQDWPAWLGEGIVDVVFPMVYFREDRHAAWFDQWAGFAAGLNPPDRTVAVGQAGYLNHHDASLAQLGRALPGVDGTAIYSYQLDAVTGRGGLLARLPEGLFADPAAPPAVPVKDAPRVGHILVAARDGQDVTVSPAGGGTASSRRTDATGHAGFVGVTPGAWSVSVDGVPAGVATVEAGRVTRVAAP